MEQSTVFAAIVGEPNVGKSTLINRLVGAKIAITANRPQTTRTRIMGVITKGETQYVFTDTPGFHAPKNRLDEHMVRCSFRMEKSVYLIILFRGECEDFPLAVYHKTERHRLHSARRELWLDLSPKYR